MCKGKSVLLSDAQIREAIKNGKLSIDPFMEPSLQPASYDLRVGKRALVSGMESEIDLEVKRSFTLKAGDFALMTTLEKIKLSSDIVAQIGMKSYYIRKGLILLAGLQIDPGWNGYLVLGMYNASPRNITLDFQSQICTVDFFELSVPSSKCFMTGDEQQLGLIPKVDKDYLRTLETLTLSDMSESVR
ncbi:MAG: dCTP deaminase [Candidatus Bathyarchaeia archaeon]|jgi:dCTP deaminase